MSHVSDTSAFRKAHARTRTGAQEKANDLK